MQNLVVVVDKTCEIGGDGVVPHPAIGNARWLPVESFKKEGQVRQPPQCSPRTAKDARRSTLEAGRGPPAQ